MSQATNLLNKYDPALTFSLKVGATAVVANKLYKRDASGLLVIAGANENAPLYYPLTAGAIGEYVECVLVGQGVFGIVADGAITKDAKLAASSTGRVKAADANDTIIGRAYNASDDGGVVTVLPYSEGPIGTAPPYVVLAGGVTSAMAGTPGVIAVSAATIAAGDLVIYSRLTAGGTLGNVSNVIAAGVGFTLTSTGNETSTFQYVILRPVS